MYPMAKPCLYMYDLKLTLIFNHVERKNNFRENWHKFWGIWGEAELILGICGARQNTLMELGIFLSWIWGDQCIILRGDRPPGGIIG